jgi:riboflavin synthase
MFTGIVEQVGIVVSFIRGSQTAKLAVSAAKIFDDVKTGDSISINGVCLTVTAVRRSFAEFDISSETLKRSGLSELKIGEKVNLERALPLSGRLGGHLVSGHIDGVGEIKSKVVSGEGFDLYLSIPSEILRYLVPQGSIAIDGVSLTVADFRDGLLRVSVIPQTVRSTTLSLKNVGEKINVEVDLISKYIERHLKGEPKGISEEVMMRMGILPMGWTDN